MACQLFVSRRRTDIIYREDGATWLEPNAPPAGESCEPVERRSLGPLPERYAPTVHVPGPPDVPRPQRPRVDRRELVPAASIGRDPQTERVERVHGVMDAEPGSEEFRRMAQLYDE